MKTENKTEKVNCGFGIIQECQKETFQKESYIIRNKQQNDNKYCCLPCSQFLLKESYECSSRNHYLHDDFLKEINTERKAYILGWIANSSNINIELEVIFFWIPKKKLNILKELRDIICTTIPITNPQKDMVTITINSKDLIKHVKKHLSLDEKNGGGTTTMKFPKLDKNLTWDFIRGIYDSGGIIFSKDNGDTSTVIHCNSSRFLKKIKEFCNFPSTIYKNRIEWNGINSIDFLGQLYKDSTIYLKEKYENFVTASQSLSIKKRFPSFKWARTCPESISPQKNRFSDSGFDLHIVKKIKVKGNVHYYDTGIRVEPEIGYYFDLVGRSSISKTGWMIANNIGIIDSSYRGSILVALIRVDPEAEELKLPYKLVQLIPRKLILMDNKEVEILSNTQREDSGGLGSGSNFLKKIVTGLSR